MTKPKADQMTVETLRHEHAIWMAQYEQWRDEHREALRLLAKVQTAIVDRESKLVQQIAAIRAHEAELEDYELIGSDAFAPDPEKQLAQHAISLELHQQARSEFLRMKEQHVHLIEETEKLFRICQSSGL